MNRENMVEIDPVQEKIGLVIIEIKKKLGEEKIKSETIHIIIKDVMELVEKFSVPGSEKKEIVIKIIKELIDDLAENEGEKKLLHNIIDKNIIGQTIDLIILASKGEFNLNNPNFKTKLFTCGKSILIISIEYLIYFFQYLKSSLNNINLNKKNTKVTINKITPPDSSSTNKNTNKI